MCVASWTAREILWTVRIIGCHGFLWTRFQSPWMSCYSYSLHNFLHKIDYFAVATVNQVEWCFSCSRGWFLHNFTCQVWMLGRPRARERRKSSKEVPPIQTFSHQACPFTPFWFCGTKRQAEPPSCDAPPLNRTAPNPVCYSCGFGSTTIPGGCAPQVLAALDEDGDGKVDLQD